MGHAHLATQELVQHLVESISAKRFEGAYALGRKLQKKALAEENNM